VGPQYSGAINWGGELVIRTLHGKKEYRVLADVIVDMTDLGVFVGWRGAAPAGVFLPWGEVVSIEQAESSG